MMRTAPSLIGGALSLAPLYPDLLKAEKNQRRDAEGAEERRGEEPFLSSFSASLCESLRLCVKTRSTERTAEFGACQELYEDVIVYNDVRSLPVRRTSDACRTDVRQRYEPEVVIWEASVVSRATRKLLGFGRRNPVPWEVPSLPWHGATS